MDHDMIRQINQDQHDFQLIKKYYLNFLKRIKDTPQYEKFQNELFYVQMKSHGKNVIRKVSKNQMLEIFGNYLEFQGFTNTWTKIFDCFPSDVEQGSQFYQITMKKDKNNKAIIDIIQKKFYNNKLQKQEYYDHEDKARGILPKQLKYNEPLKSKSKLINSICENFINSIVSFIENKLNYLKFKLMFLQIQIIKFGLLMLNKQNKQIQTQIKLRNLIFLILSRLDNKLFQKNNNAKVFIANIMNFSNRINQSGIILYLNYNQIKNNDNHLWEKNNVITKKSIFLDYVERIKTIEKISQICEIPKEQAQKIGESLLFKHRLCDVLQSDVVFFKNLNNMHQKVNLCKNCQNIYFNIDKIRSQKLPNKYDNQIIIQDVQNNFEQNTKKTPIQKEIFSGNLKLSIQNITKPQKFIEFSQMSNTQNQFYRNKQSKSSNKLPQLQNSNSSAKLDGLSYRHFTDFRVKIKKNQQIDSNKDVQQLADNYEKHKISRDQNLQRFQNVVKKVMRINKFRFVKGDNRDLQKSILGLSLKSKN